MNLEEILKSILSIEKRLDVIRSQLGIIDCTEDESREIQERKGLLNEIESSILHSEDWLDAIEYRIKSLLG